MDDEVTTCEQQVLRVPLKWTVRLTRVLAPAFETSPRALLGPGSAAALPTGTVVVDEAAVLPTMRPAAASEAVELLPISLGCAC